MNSHFSIGSVSLLGARITNSFQSRGPPVIFGEPDPGSAVDWPAGSLYSSSTSILTIVGGTVSSPLTYTSMANGAPVPFFIVSPLLNIVGGTAGISGSVITGSMATADSAKLTPTPICISICFII